MSSHFIGIWCVSPMCFRFPCTLQKAQELQWTRLGWAGSALTVSTASLQCHLEINGCEDRNSARLAVSRSTPSLGTQTASRCAQGFSERFSAKHPLISAWAAADSWFFSITLLYHDAFTYANTRSGLWDLSSDSGSVEILKSVCSLNFVVLQWSPFASLLLRYNYISHAWYLALLPNIFCHM